MDLTFTPETTTTPPPLAYGSLLPAGLAVPYSDSYGIASLVARDFTLATFFMLTAYTGRPSHPKSLFNCDFEDGWCPGFKNHKKSDIPWELYKGRTPSNKTGPNVDHTRFNEYGTYIYLEASKVRSSETAVFTTPSVLLLDEPNYCLRFWYHMYGAGMGSLWVFWNGGGTDTLNQAIDKHSGERSKNGRDWRESQTTIPNTITTKYYRPTRFEFRAIRGASYKSDIAVDDIVLLPGKCTDRYFPRTATTMTFNGITTTPQPNTTTTPHWKATHHAYSQCGENKYFNPKKEICCSGKVTRNPDKRYYQCCREKAFHSVYEICCGGGKFSSKDYRCCAGNLPYKKTERGCCANQNLFYIRTEECVNNKVVKMKKKTPKRGRRGRKNRG